MPYGVADFPLLSDIEAEVWRKLDQPLDEIGQLTWNADVEFNQAARSEFQYLWERISSLDRNWGLKVTTATLTAGSRIVTLPTDCRKVREVFEMRGGEEDTEHASGPWELLGRAEYTFRFRPDLRELYYMRDPDETLTLRLVYYYTPPDLFHGYVQSSGTRVTGTPNVYTATFAAHETSESNRINGRDCYAVEGTGAPGIGVIAGYNGVSKLTTINVDTTDSDYSDFGSAFDNTTKVTCRPDLPWSAKDAFVYGICARLLDKLEDDRWRVFEARRERHLDALRTDVMQLEGNDAIQTHDSSAGHHGDAYYDW